MRTIRSRISKRVEARGKRGLQTSALRAVRQSYRLMNLVVIKTVVRENRGWNQKTGGRWGAYIELERRQHLRGKTRQSCRECQYHDVLPMQNKGFQLLLSLMMLLQRPNRVCT